MDKTSRTWMDPDTVARRLSGFFMRHRSGLACDDMIIMLDSSADVIHVQFPRSFWE